MRLIKVTKALVNSDFTGFRYQLYSTVRYNYSDRNLIPGTGQLLELNINSAKVFNYRKNKIEIVNYSDMHDPIAVNLPKMMLPAIEKRAINYIKKYQRSPVIIDGISYILPKPANLQINFELSMLSSDPNCMGSARRAGSDLTITLLVPYLQYAKPSDINKVILHEVAHLLAGMDAGHDKLWEQICLEIKGSVKAPLTSFTQARGKVSPANVYTRGSYAYSLINDIASCPIFTDADAISEVLDFIKLHSNSDLTKYQASYYVNIFSNNLLDIANWDKFNDRLVLMYNLFRQFNLALKLINYSDKDKYNMSAVQLNDIIEARELAAAYADNLGLAFNVNEFGN